MRNKKILSLVVVLAGIACSAYLLLSNQNVGAKSLTITGSERTNGRFVDINKEPVPSLNEPNFNATDQTVKAYELAIFENNKGKKSGDKISLPNEIEIQNIIQKYTTQPIVSKTYERKDIIINKTSSLSELSSYIKSIENEEIETQRKAPTNIASAIALFVSEKKSDELQKHINSQTEYIDFLLKKPVIPEWENFHLALLNNAERKRTLSLIILENPDDPIKTIAVIDNLSKLITNEEMIWNSALSSLQ